MFGPKEPTEQQRLEEWHRNRLLFHYWDGQRSRALDPLRACREMQSDSSVDLEAAGQQAEHWEEPGTTQLVELSCRLFAIKRFEPETGEGLTDAEILNLFYDLNEYLDEVKKKFNLGLTLPPPTEPPA